jgi:hypothetical protein
MVKKITLATLAEQLAKMDARMEKGFAAVAEDMSKLATKDQIIALHTQVTGIEADIKTTKSYKLPSRMADVEEELFGKARG